MPNTQGNSVASAALTDNSTTASVSLTAAAGSCIVVCVSHEVSTSEALTGVSDGTNTYTSAGSPIVGANGVKQYMFVAKNVAAGSYTITATFDANAFGIAIHATEIIGADTVAPQGLYGGQSQNTAPNTTDGATSGSLGTPAQNGHYVYAVCRYNGATDGFAAGTGYTSMTACPSGGPVGVNNPSLAERVIQTTATGVTATFTVDPAAITVISVVTIKPASGLVLTPSGGEFTGQSGTPSIIQQFTALVKILLRWL